MFIQIHKIHFIIYFSKGYSILSKMGKYFYNTPSKSLFPLLMPHDKLYSISRSCFPGLVSEEILGVRKSKYTRSNHGFSLTSSMLINIFF